MKKTYITPETLTVALGTCQMMAASNPDVTINSLGSVNAGEVGTKEAVSDVNVWDEEW